MRKMGLAVSGEPQESSGWHLGKAPGMGGSPRPLKMGQQLSCREAWRGSPWTLWGLLWLELSWKTSLRGKAKAGSPGAGRGLHWEATGCCRDGRTDGWMVAAFGLR